MFCQIMYLSLGSGKVPLLLGTLCLACTYRSWPGILSQDTHYTSCGDRMLEGRRVKAGFGKDHRAHTHLVQQFSVVRLFGQTEARAKACVEGQ